MKQRERETIRQAYKAYKRMSKASLEEIYVTSHNVDKETLVIDIMTIRYGAKMFRQALEPINAKERKVEARQLINAYHAGYMETGVVFRPETTETIGGYDVSLNAYIIFFIITQTGKIRYRGEKENSEK